MSMKLAAVCLLSLFQSSLYSQRGVHPGLNLTGPGGRGSSNWIQPDNKSADRLKKQRPGTNLPNNNGEKKTLCGKKEETSTECIRTEQE